MRENFKALSLKVYTMPENVSNLEWALWNSRASLPENLLHDATDELTAMQERIEKLENGIRRIVKGEYDNARTIDAAEKFARELLHGDK